MAAEEAEVHVRIEGRVQGVYYRQWTMTEALNRRLSGWVRNRADGSVEALFKGRKDKVEDMLAACRKGPPSAFVTSVEQIVVPQSQTPLPTEGDFKQLPTF